jgi:hypothetical protein
VPDSQALAQTFLLLIRVRFAFDPVLRRFRAAARCSFAAVVRFRAAFGSVSLRFAVVRFSAGYFYRGIRRIRGTLRAVETLLPAEAGTPYIRMSKIRLRIKRRRDEVGALVRSSTSSFFSAGKFIAFWTRRACSQAGKKIANSD